MVPMPANNRILPSDFLIVTVTLARTGFASLRFLLALASCQTLLSLLVPVRSSFHGWFSGSVVIMTGASAFNVLAQLVGTSPRRQAYTVMFKLQGQMMNKLLSS